MPLTLRVDRLLWTVSHVQSAIQSARHRLMNKNDDNDIHNSSNSNHATNVNIIVQKHYIISKNG